MEIRKKYKNKTEEIKALFDKYKKMSNATYWTGILALASFFLVLFNVDSSFSLGFGINLLLHYLLKDIILNKVILYLILLLSVVIPGIGFFLLSRKIKKGKLVPLIISIIIYSIDFFMILFIHSSYYESGYNQLLAYGTHIIVLFYFLYLLYLYNRMVKLSNENSSK